MARIVGSGGGAASAMGGFASGFAGAKQQQVQNQQNQQRLDMAQRALQLEEAYRAGKMEERQMLMDQTAAQVEMDVMESQGLGDRGTLSRAPGKAAGVTEAGMEGAGFSAGGAAAGVMGGVMESFVQDRVAPHLARWDETFKEMGSAARGQLLSDMAKVKAADEQNRRFVGERSSLFSAIQSTRRSSNDLERIDPALEALSQQVQEAESPEELANYQQSYEQLKGEVKDTLRWDGWGTRLEEWLGSEDPKDEHGLHSDFLFEVREGRYNSVHDAKRDYLKMSDPELFSMDSAEVRQQKHQKSTFEQMKMAQALVSNMYPEGTFEPREGESEADAYKRNLAAAMGYVRSQLGLTPARAPIGPQAGGTQQQVAPGGEVTPEQQTEMITLARKLQREGQGPDEIRAALSEMQAGFGSGADAPTGGDLGPGEQGPPVAVPTTEGKPEKMPKKEYEGVIVGAARMLKLQVSLATAPNRLGAMLGELLPPMAARELPLVLGDLEKALEELGVEVDVFALMGVENLRPGSRKQWTPPALAAEPEPEVITEQPPR